MAIDTRWAEARQIIGDRRVTLGPQGSQQWIEAPDHLAMVLARYRAAAALIGDARFIREVGCGEGIGAGILAQGRELYLGIDTDADAIAVARQIESRTVSFSVADAREPEWPEPGIWEATVALDVIEHVPGDDEDWLIMSLARRLNGHGVCVIGTPSASFEHLASAQSRAGHCNLYTHDRLRALMARHFHVVQMFGMQDTALHFGHPDARHYHLAVGIGPRTETQHG